MRGYIIFSWLSGFWPVNHLIFSKIFCFLTYLNQPPVSKFPTQIVVLSRPSSKRLCSQISKTSLLINETIWEITNWRSCSFSEGRAPQSALERVLRFNEFLNYRIFGMWYCIHKAREAERVFHRFLV